MKINVEVVTGFLGYGKTSFINSLLKESQVEGEKVLVIQKRKEIKWDEKEGNVLGHGSITSTEVYAKVALEKKMIGIMMGSIAVFGIIYYFVTLLPKGEDRR